MKKHVRSVLETGYRLKIALNGFRCGIRPPFVNKKGRFVGGSIKKPSRRRANFGNERAGLNSSAQNIPVAWTKIEPGLHLRAPQRKEIPFRLLNTMTF